MSATPRWKTISLYHVFSVLLLFSAIVLYNFTATSPDPESALSRIILVVMDKNYPPYVFLDDKGVGIIALCLLIVILFSWNHSLNQAVKKRSLELKAREQELIESECRYRGIIENMQDTFYRTDAQGTVILVSPSGAKSLGYDSLQEIIGHPVTSFWVHPEKREEMMAILQRDGIVRDYEIVLKQKDGLAKTIATTSSLYYGQEGQVLGVEGILRDITERKVAEAAIIDERNFSDDIINSLPGIFYIVDVRGRLIRWNNKFVEVTGYSPQELLGKQVLDFFSEDHKTYIGERIQSVFSTGESSAEAPLSLKDGRQIPYHFTGKMAALDGREYLLGVGNDITARKLAEEELLAERQHLMDIIDFLPDATFVVDTEGRVVAWNRAAEAMTGVNRDELLGQGNYVYAVPFYKERRPILIDLVDLSEQEIEKNYTQVRRSGEKVYAETFIQDFNEGNGVYLFGVAAPLYDRHGKRTGAIEVIRDISALKQTENEKSTLQEQLMQVQKMDSIGRLAGGVAHDFNNMLGVILGYTELAQRKVDPSQAIFRNLEEIHKAARRSADITQKLLAFARKQTVSPRMLDLNTTVEGMLNMLRRLIGENILLLWQPEKNLWPICVDPSQIDQILANLCLNARSAITNIGTITIKSGNCTFTETYCADYPDFMVGEYVCLTVGDNGCGMDKETLALIFEPFFTTKGLGEGTGLGLATVYGAVKQNNGFIHVESEPGQGATFTIYFPRYLGQTATLPLTDAQTEPRAQGVQTVLLVEDEPVLQEMFTRMLNDLGYTVLSATTPGEAIRLAREHAGEIHLLMTDVIMPEMNGRDLADKILSLYPNLSCLFMSGYPADVIAHHGVLDAGRCFLQKPFTLTQMATKIREALGNPAMEVA